MAANKYFGVFNRFPMSSPQCTACQFRAAARLRLCLLIQEARGALKAILAGASWRHSDNTAVSIKYGDKVRPPDRSSIYNEEHASQLAIFIFDKFGGLVDD